MHHAALGMHHAALGMHHAALGMQHAALDCNMQRWWACNMPRWVATRGRRAYRKPVQRMSVAGYPGGVPVLRGRGAVGDVDRVGAVVPSFED